MSKTIPVPEPALEQVKERFIQWRENKNGHKPIPEEL
jgi:hypothetical protein